MSKNDLANDRKSLIAPGSKDESYGQRHEFPP
jgi:hypothetical protein